MSLSLFLLASSAASLLLRSMSARCLARRVLCRLSFLIVVLSVRLVGVGGSSVSSDELYDGLLDELFEGSDLVGSGAGGGSFFVAGCGGGSAD